MHFFFLGGGYICFCLLFSLENEKCKVSDFLLYCNLDMFLEGHNFSLKKKKIQIIWHRNYYLKRERRQMVPQKYLFWPLLDPIFHQNNNILPFAISFIDIVNTLVPSYSDRDCTCQLFFCTYIGLQQMVKIIKYISWGISIMFKISIRHCGNLIY